MCTCQCQPRDFHYTGMVPLAPTIILTIILPFRWGQNGGQIYLDKYEVLIDGMQVHFQQNVTLICVSLFAFQSNIYFLNTINQSVEVPNWFIYHLKLYNWCFNMCSYLAEGQRTRPWSLFWGLRQIWVYSKIMKKIFFTCLEHKTYIIWLVLT